jgi:transcriptional regulator with XRE-family HTH domain
VFGYYLNRPPHTLCHQETKIKAGPKPTVTQRDREQIAEMLARGLSQREVARAVGLSQPTISRIAIALRAEPPKPQVPDPDASPEEFVSAFADDESLKCLQAIGQHENLNPSLTLAIAQGVAESHLERLWGPMLDWRDRALKAWRFRWRRA